MKRTHLRDVGTLRQPGGDMPKPITAIATQCVSHLLRFCSKATKQIAVSLPILHHCQDCFSDTYYTLIMNLTKLLQSAFDNYHPFINTN